MSTNKAPQPVVFIGHGSPMNAIADNAFTRALTAAGKSLSQPYSKPQLILCISAHWGTKGTYITSATQPKMIYDMYGFPEDLYKVKYPAPGAPDVAKLISQQSSNPHIALDEGAWGLDHGSWSVLKFLFPKADVPVMQLSMDMSQPPEFHLELGQQLRELRKQGVLIVGSGNVVHNLRRIDWNPNAPVTDWAKDYDTWVSDNIAMSLQTGNFSKLATDYMKPASAAMALPTNEHYLPLLYVLGAINEGDQQKLIYDGIEHASISMRSMMFTAS